MATDFTPRLTPLQDMAVHDASGRCRCPWCGRFRRLRDFARQPASYRAGPALVDGDPRCKDCQRQRART